MNANRFFLVIAAHVCWSFAGKAQTASADDYFNRAGKQYVKEDKGAALRTLGQGLEHYPGDARLLKLAEELLKEEQQKQQQQQRQQEQQQKDQEQQEQQKKQEQQQREQEEKQRQQEQQAKEGEQDPKSMEPQAGRIAPQDAKRILDALERSEKDVQQKVRERQRPARRVTIDKDW